MFSVIVSLSVRISWPTIFLCVPQFSGCGMKQPSKLHEIMFPETAFRAHAVWHSQHDIPREKPVIDDFLPGP